VSILNEAIAQETTLNCVGICHHAFGMQSDFACLLEVPTERVRVEYQGLNHLGWVTDVLVDGLSRRAELIRRLVQRRVTAYDYQLAAAFEAIPIKHAAALYHRGEVFYVRQSGARASLAAVALRSGVGRTALERIINRGEPDDAGAPWYARCVVPFLNAVVDGLASELIVTWRHAGQPADLPGLTAEATAIVTGDRVEAASVHSRLPLAAREWLRQVRESERLLLCAVKHQSPSTLVAALAIHPSVASVRHE
jgi:alpha-galactosidase/6-phospho-beta-glucosidase family protein